MAQRAWPAPAAFNGAGREVGIAGAGLGGLALAALLGRAGWRVVVFDKLDRPAPLGSGLIVQPVGMAVLAALGLAEEARALGARIDRLFGRAAPHGRTVLDVRYRALGAGSFGLGMHRGALFQLLFDAARGAGAAFETGRVVAGHDDGRFVFADGAASARFPLLVDALGVRSPLSPQPGRDLAYGALWASLTWLEGGRFDPHALEQRYVAARRMAGVLPIGRLRRGEAPQAAFFWSLKGSALSAWRAGALAAWKDEVRRVWGDLDGLLAQIDNHDDLIHASYAHRTLNSPVSGGVVHLGDSFRCTSPQLGQGANMALLDAFALAHALAVMQEQADALQAYARMRMRHTRLYQAASWMFTPVYQSDSRLLPWMRDWIVGPLSRLPPAPQILAALVAGVLGAPLHAISRDLVDARAAAMLPNKNGLG